MGRQTIHATNCWFVREKDFVSDATGQYIPGKTIELKFTADGKNYSVVLKSAAQGEWVGDYTVGGASRAVRAKLYMAEDKSMVLVGKWPESNNDYTWLVDHIGLEGDDEA